MKIVLYQPDMAGNLGAIMRLCACFETPLEIIEPCGFPLTAKSLKRAAMDYANPQTLTRHANWQQFCDSHHSERLVLLTTLGETHLADFQFHPQDALIFGQESAGVPASVHQYVDARLKISMSPQARSLNLANSVSITLYEALRQTQQLPTRPD